MIELSEGATYKELRTRPGVMTLQIENAKLPDELVRTLDVSAYKGFLRAISSYPAPGKREATLIEVDHAEGATEPRHAARQRARVVVRGAGSDDRRARPV